MIENATTSLEGATAIAALMMPGAWRRAGMAGAVVGLDMDAALSRVDMTGIDITVTRRLIARGETGLITGAARLSRSRDRDAGEGGE